MQDLDLCKELAFGRPSVRPVLVRQGRAVQHLAVRPPARQEGVHVRHERVAVDNADLAAYLLVTGHLLDAFAQPTECALLDHGQRVKDVGEAVVANEDLASAVGSSPGRGRATRSRFLPILLWALDEAEKVRSHLGSSPCPEPSFAHHTM